MQSVLNSKILSPKALINFVFKLSAELSVQTAVTYRWLVELRTQKPCIVIIVRLKFVHGGFHCEVFGFHFMVKVPPIMLFAILPFMECVM